MIFCQINKSIPQQPWKPNSFQYNEANKWGFKQQNDFVQRIYYIILIKLIG